MNIEAEKKRLQIKLDKVFVKLEKENAKFKKAEAIIHKTTNAIQALGAIDNMLSAQIAVLKEYTKTV